MPLHTPSGLITLGVKRVSSSHPKYIMKTNHVIWILGLFTAFVAHECRADLNGSDDFNDNSKDPARWGADFTAGVGLLSETNGRLEFTTSGATTSLDMAARPWILNFGSYTQNWETHIDVNVPQLPRPETRFGLIIASGTNSFSANNLRLDFVQTTNKHYITANLAVNGSKISVGTDKPTTSTLVALRIAFDANTQVLSAFYDEDGPTCGYSWTLLGSTNVPVEWNMTSTSVFGVWLFGYSAAALGSTNNVFGDNFYASTGPTPTLGISVAGGKAVLAWSSNAPSCWLEVASTLTPPICWQVVSHAPGIVGTNFTVTNAVSSDEGFYRLSR